MVSGNAADDELLEAVTTTDDVVSFATTMLREPATDVLGTSVLDVLFATATNGAEEVAVLVSDWLVEMMRLFEGKSVLDDWDDVVEFKRAVETTEDVALGGTTVLMFELDCAALLSVPSDVPVLETTLDAFVDVLLLGTAMVLEVEGTSEVEFDVAKIVLVIEGVVLLLAATEVKDEVVPVRVALVVRGTVLLIATTAEFDDEARDEVVLETAGIELLEGTTLLLVETTVLADEARDEVVIDAAGTELVVEVIVLLTANTAVFGSEAEEELVLLEAVRLEKIVEETVEEIVLLLAKTTVLESDA